MQDVEVENVGQWHCLCKREYDDLKRTKTSGWDAPLRSADSALCGGQEQPAESVTLTKQSHE